LLFFYVRTAHQTTITGLALCHKKLNVHALRPKGYCPYHHVPHSWNLHPACRVYLWVLYGPQNKQQLIPCTWLVLVTKTMFLNNAVMTELLYTILVHGFRCGGPTSIPGQSMWDMWWTKWHWAKSFSDYFSFTQSVSVQKCSILIFTYILQLPEGKTGKNLPNNALSKTGGGGGAFDRKFSKLLKYFKFTRASNLYNTKTTVKTVLTSKSSSNHPVASVIQKWFTLSQLIK
jgi:hypothetical protein